MENKGVTEEDPEPSTTAPLKITRDAAPGNQLFALRAQ
jgi:hypothetical protein